MERKTPRRAGGPRPTNPPPWVGVGGAGGTVPTTRQIYQCIRALKPVSWPLAASLLLTHCGGDLGDFFGAGSLCVLNFFRASGLSPSGGHILSSPAKKEYGKKDAAQGGGPRPTDPPPWVGVGGMGGLCSDYQTNLSVHLCPVRWCAGRLPLRCCLRTAVVAWEIFFGAAPCSVSTKKISAMAASKSAPAVVSASAAASGLLTRSDDGCSRKSVWYSIQCAAVVPTPHPRGGSLGRDPPP